MQSAPKLRFSGFSDLWSAKRMDSFLVFQRGFDLTKNQSSPGPHPVYSSSGISYYHTEAKVKAPGIVTGRKGSIGPVFFVEEDFWPHDTALWVKDFKGNVPIYVYHFLIQFGLERYDESSSVPTLNRNNVHRLKVAFPTVPEQRKIADFLTAVDGRIGQLIQKKALLEDYKKGVMQQLFTQAIRFKDDHGNDFPDWEEKKLGDLFEITSSKRVFQSEWREEGIPFYRAREIIKLGSNGWVDNELFITEDMFEDYAAKYGAPQQEDLLVTGVGTIGKVYRVSKGGKFYFKDGNIVWLKASGNVDSVFVEQLFRSRIVQKQIAEGAAITTVATFTIVAAKGIKIPFPSSPTRQ